MTNSFQEKNTGTHAISINPTTEVFIFCATE